MKYMIKSKMLATFCASLPADSFNHSTTLFLV